MAGKTLTHRQDLHKARLEGAKREIVRGGLFELACGHELPDEVCQRLVDLYKVLLMRRKLRDIVSITAVALGGYTADDHQALVDEALEGLDVRKSLKTCNRARRLKTMTGPFIHNH